MCQSWIPSIIEDKGKILFCYNQKNYPLIVSELDKSFTCDTVISSQEKTIKLLEDIVSDKNKELSISDSISVNQEKINKNLKAISVNQDEIIEDLDKENKFLKILSGGSLVGNVLAVIGFILIL